MINLTKYIIKDKQTFFQALKKINDNKKGFLIVVSHDNTVKGTLTDGDIRRAFLSGSSIDDYIENAYKDGFISLHVGESVCKAIDLFKNSSIKFLPIIDGENKLVNVITKNQLHAMLLQDIHADFNYDFQKLDDSIVDHEVFQRPWGFYKTTVMNNYCQAKIICVYPKSQLSLQSHDHREEHWIVAHGEGQVQIGESYLDAKCGSVFFIPKGCKHRLTNTHESEYLILTELQIGDYFGEDDIHRYEDIYGRM